ncbi:MAG: PucR family transcriptional regulator [bacterium]|jgi:purine catabolism regulator
MRISIGEIVGLAGLDCIYLTGEQAENNIVEHVGILQEGPEAQTRFDKVLLLAPTAAIPTKQVCQDLMRRGVTAIGLVGPECPQLPAALKTFGDESFFPILYFPSSGDLSFPAVKILNEIILRANTEAWRRRVIHGRFTHIAMSSGSLIDLATALYQLIGCPIAIYDMYNEQRILIPEGHPSLANLRLDTLPTEALKTGWQPFRIEATPERPFNLIITGIIVDKMTYGYLVVAEGGNRLQATELVAIDHAAIALALQLVKEKATQDAYQNLRNDLLDEILNAEVDDTARNNLILRSRSLGWDLERNYITIAFGIDGMERYYSKDVNRGSIPWRTCMEHCLKQIGDLARELDPNAIVAGHSDTIILLLRVEPAQSPQKMRQRLVKLASNIREAAVERLDGIGLSVGIGESTGSLLEIGPSYREAREALLYGRSIFGPGSIVPFSELGIYRLLLRFTQREDLEEFYQRTVGILVEFDAQQDSHLVPTLEALVANNGQMQKAAESFNIHYNTLKYRLQKIKELTGLDWHEAEGRLNLHIGLKLRQVIGNNNN